MSNQFPVFLSTNGAYDFTEVIRGPQGPAGTPANTVSYENLTDGATVNLPTYNTPLATALTAQTTAINAKQNQLTAGLGISFLGNQISGTDYAFPVPTGGTGIYTNPFTNADGSGGIATALANMFTASEGTMHIRNGFYAVTTGNLSNNSSQSQSLTIQSANEVGPNNHAPGPSLSNGACLVLTAGQSSCFLVGNTNYDCSVNFKNISIFGSSATTQNTNTASNNIGVMTGSGTMRTLYFDSCNFLYLTSGVATTASATGVITNMVMNKCRFESCAYPIQISATNNVYGGVIRDCYFDTIQYNSLTLLGTTPSTEPTQLLLIDRCDFLNTGLLSNVSAGAGTIDILRSNVVVSNSSFGFAGLPTSTTNSIGQPSIITSSCVDCHVIGNFFNAGTTASNTISTTFAPFISQTGNAFDCVYEGNIFTGGWVATQPVLWSIFSIGAATNSNLVNVIRGNTFSPSQTSNWITRGIVVSSNSSNQTRNFVIEGNTFRNLTSIDVIIGQFNSGNYIGDNIWSITAGVINVSIGTSSNGNIIYLKPGMTVQDNGTGTVLLNYELVTIGLVTLTGSPVSQVHVGQALTAGPNIAISSSSVISAPYFNNLVSTDVSSRILMSFAIGSPAGVGGTLGRCLGTDLWGFITFTTGATPGPPTNILLVFTFAGGPYGTGVASPIVQINDFYDNNGTQIFPAVSSGQIIASAENTGASFDFRNSLTLTPNSTYCVSYQVIGSLFSS